MKPGLSHLTAIACIASAACVAYENPVPSRRMEVGQVIARLSQPDSAVVFESLQMLAVAPDAESVYVLDRLARRVYRVSIDGGVLTAFGEQGYGPREIADAVAIRASPRGVWVLDGERGRFLLFSPDGDHLETVAPAVQWTLGRTFAPVDGGLIFPDLSSFGSPVDDEVSLLGYTPLADSGFVSFDFAGEIPNELISGSDMRSMMERQIGWLLHAVAPGEVGLVLNRGNPTAWTIRWQNDRITDIEALRVPPEVHEAIRDILRTDRPPLGVELRPVTGMHAVNGRLWITTAGIQPKLLGFSLSKSARVVPTVVQPGSFHGQARIRDGVVIGERFIAITETEILWTNLVNLTGKVESGGG